MSSAPTLQAKQANRRSNRRRAILIVLGYAAGLACLAWVLSGVRWRELSLELRGTKIEWLIAAALFGLLTYIYNAWRWNLLLQPIARLKLRPTARAFYIGLFANELLPLRPGEVICSYLLAAWSPIEFSTAVSSVALERLLDGFTLAISFSFAALFLPLPKVLILGVRIMAGVLVIATLMLLFLLWKRPKVVHLPSRIRGWLKPAFEGLRLMTNMRTLVLSVAASFGNLALQTLPYWALNKSYHLDLSIWAVIAVVIIVRTAVIIPTAPGNAGVLQAACILGLGLFGIGKTRAMGFVALLFVVMDLPLLIGGASVAASAGVGIHKLGRAMKSVDSADVSAS